MKTINDDNKYEIIIKKSRFITYLYKVKTLEEVNNYLAKIKHYHSDANHVCYGYVIDNIQKCSDDREPSGTAGMPILNVLIRNDINFCLAIVVRYFGGIKLGAGGLIRAYSKATIECLKENQIIELEQGMLIKITIPYSQQKILDNLIKDYAVKEKVFDNNLIYIIESDQKLISVLRSKNIDFIIVKNIYIKKL